MLQRIWTLAVKELIHLWRDKLILLFVLLGPISELAMVAWATSGDIEHIPAAIVDRDLSAASRELVQALENTETIDADFYVQTEKEARALVDGGAALVAILIPPDFEERLRSADKPAQMQVILDGADPSAARAVQMSAEGAIATYSQNIALERLGPMAAGAGEVIGLDVRVWFNEELKTSHYEVPSELGFMLAGIALMLASLGIARERELGTLEQFMVTPLRSLELHPGQGTACPDAVLPEFSGHAGLGRLCLQDTDARLMVLVAAHRLFLPAHRDGMGADDFGSIQDPGPGIDAGLFPDHGRDGLFRLCVSRGEHAASCCRRSPTLYPSSTGC